MDKERALEYWINRYNYAKDYSDIHWDAEERHEHRDYVDAMAWAIKAIEQYADVQPVKRGEWVCNEELYYNGMAKCSCCEAEFYVEDLQTLQGDAECVKFCPNCGADMIGDENG